MRSAARVLGIVLVGTAAACQVTDSPTMPDTTPALARATSQQPINVNVLLNQPATDAILAELSRYGRVRGRIDALDAVFLAAVEIDLATLRALPFVEAVSPDAERSAGPTFPPVGVTDFASGRSTWNLDAMGVTDLGVGRTVAADGSGVYVGVLDTGLLDSWPFYFPDERIAEEYARSFGGGGATGGGAVSTQPNKWQRDVVSHGTHVASAILGFNLDGVTINGVAPKATVIPVKVLGNGGGGWASAVAAGIVYIADLKTGPLAGSPVVINMSLGGALFDVVERAAIDYAVARGVIVVASAGNRGDAGMGFPGAYPPVISVGSFGWVNEWVVGPWWVALDVADPTNGNDFYVSDFSSRQKAGQDLDVLGPGSWIVGPWQEDQGRVSYAFVGGTSASSPHVAGLVALMAQADPSLDAAAAEAALEGTAIPLPAGTRSVRPVPGVAPQPTTWGADAHGSGIVSAPAALAAVGGS